MKKAYHMAVRRVHPDKLSGDAGASERALAASLFDALQSGWSGYRDGGWVREAVSAAPAAYLSSPHRTPRARGRPCRQLLVLTVESGASVSHCTRR